MDINVNISVNSQPLVEANKQFKEANESAVNLNKTLSDKTGESQIKKNTNELVKNGRAMTGLRTAVSGFDRLVGTEIGGAAETVGSLGKVFAGLGRAIPLVTTAFRAMGAALLTNPIFLIGAAITGVVVALGALLNAFGFLQPIIDGISALIGGLVEGFKSLTNAIGLTSASMEDGKKEADAYAKAIDGINSAKDGAIARARNEIELAEAQGKSIEEITALRYKETKAEGEASIDREQAYLKRIEILNNEFDRASTTATRRGEIELELAELDKKIKSEIDIREANNTKVKIIQIEQRKAIAEREEKRIADELARRKTQALEAVRIVEEQQKLEVLKTKEGSAEKIIAQINELDAIFEIRKKYAKDLGITDLQLQILDQERINSISKLKVELEKLGQVQMNILKGFDFSNITGEVRNSTNEIIEQGMLLSVNYAAMQQKILNKYKEQLDVAKLVAEQDNVDYNTKINNINELYSIQERVLKAQQALEITNAEETGANVELINEKYRAIFVQNEQKKAEEIKKVNKQIFDAGVDSANEVISAFGAFSEFMFENRKKMLQEGSKEEEAAAKEQFEVRKRMAIASAIISGISGVVNILAAPTTLPDPIGAIYKGVQIAALAISTAAQIGKISSQTFESSSASVGGGGATTQSGASATPSMNLFGQGNQMNVSSAQPTTTVSDPNGNVLRVIAEVSETEITAVQMRNRRYYNSSEL